MVESIETEMQEDAPPYSALWYQGLRRMLGEAGCRQLGFYEFPADWLLSVVIPVYNEKSTLRQVVERIKSVPIPKELILVDDCSTDGTPAVLDTFRQERAGEPGAKISWHFRRHARNGGKGKAIQTALQAATGDIAVIHDADLEYHPEDLLRIVQVFVDEGADAVFGSRFAGGDVRRVLHYRHVTGQDATEQPPQNVQK